MSTRQERQAAVRELTVQLDQLEKQLQESSKVRSAAVLALCTCRGAGVPGLGGLAAISFEPALQRQPAVSKAASQALGASAECAHVLQDKTSRLYLLTACAPQVA